MSIQKVIQESIAGNPFEMKESLAEELRGRVAEALAAKMEEVELDEALDHEGLKKDFGDSDAKVHSVETAHKVEAEVIGHKSFKTDKGKVPVLKHYDRENFEHKEVPLRKGQKLVHDGYEHYHGYSSTHGHFRVHEDDINTKHLRESVEELDEISKKTLGSYIKKANVNAMNHARKSGEYNNPDHPKHFNKAMDRMRGIKKATDKLVAKEEVEELDELKKSTLGSYIKKASTNQIGNTAAVLSGKNDPETERVRRRMGQRMSGIAKATDKLTKEEVEQIDEISKKTMGSYVNKAADDISHIQRDITSSGTKSPDYKNLSRMRRNRKTGIATAVKKLTKE